MGEGVSYDLISAALWLIDGQRATVNLEHLDAAARVASEICSPSWSWVSDYLSCWGAIR
jgi:hypothetical protein